MEARVGIVTGRKTEPSRKGSIPVRRLQVQLTDTRDVQTVQLVGQAGEESNPPNGSLVVVLPGGIAFKLAVGTDDGIIPIMAPGGKRIYSTGPDGTVIAEIKLDPDGSITATNPGASLSIDPAGNVTILAAGTTDVQSTGVLSITAPQLTFNGPLQVNGTFDSTGTVTAPLVEGTTDVTFGGKSSIAHVHDGVQPGTGQSGDPV